MSYLFLWLAAATGAALACWAWRPLAIRLQLLDRPGERSLHSEPMPRAAGVPMALITSAALLFVPLEGATVTAVGLAGLLVVVSVVDDRRPLPVLPRLIVYLCVSLYFVAAGLGVPATLQTTELLLAGTLVLGLTWMTNLYNFMDGSDGLAGGQGAIGFAALAGLGLLAGHAPAAWMALTISGVCAGFLVWNFPPAKLFLGDAGAIPLGFLAGALALVLIVEAEVSPWLAVLPFAPFWLDATFTLFRRVVARESFWKPHRRHWYQRLVQSGFGHRGTALIAYAAMAVCSVAAIISRRFQYPLFWEILLFGLILLSLAGLGWWISSRSQAQDSKLV